MVTTDARGRWRCVVDEEKPSIRTLRVTSVDRPAAALVGEVALRAPRARSVDLGAVRLRPAPVIVAGSVVDRDGRPAAGVRLFVLGSQERNPDDWGPALGRVAAVSGPDGRFEVRGNLEPFYESDRMDAFALRAHCAQSGSPLVAFELGTTDLRVVAPGTARLSIQIRAPAGFDRRRFRFMFGRSDAHEVRLRLVATARPDTWTTSAWGLEPGTYRVRADYAGITIADIPGLTLTPGENHDERVSPLDLVARMRTVQLAIVDQRGEPMRRVGIALERGDEFDLPRETELDAGIVAVLVPRGPVDVRVEADGYRPASANLVGDEHRLVLRDGLPVEITLDSEIPLQAGWTLITRWSRPPERPDRGGVIGYERTFDPDGVAYARLPGPGAWDVELALKTETTMVRIAQRLIDVPEARGPKRFTLSVGAEELAKALEDLRR